MSSRCCLFARSVLLICVSLFGVGPANADEPPAPELPYTHAITENNLESANLSAIVSSSGNAGLVYTEWEIDPSYDFQDTDYIRFMSNDGLANTVVPRSRHYTAPGQPALESPAVAVRLDGESWRYHAAYIYTGPCLLPAEGDVVVFSRIVRFATSHDGGTVWDGGICSQGSYIPDATDAVSLDAVLNFAASPPGLMVVAYIRDSDGDGYGDKVYLAQNTALNSALFESPLLIDQDAPEYPTRRHRFNDISIQVSSSGTYHLAYLDNWWAESGPLSSRRVVYVAQGFAPLAVVNYPWDSQVSLSRRSIY